MGEGILGGQGGIWGIPWGIRVGLMSLLMIHDEAYNICLVMNICLYISDPDFSCGRMDGQAEVFHEALTDLKIENGGLYKFLS